MIVVRPSAERGHFRSDWLDSRHTFSFDIYHDPEHMGFRALRVINEDRVKPGHGFPLHRHEEMEILSFVLAGRLKHEDDLGHAGEIGPCQLQRITAGTGIRHSESNPSDSETVHFLQIWILPESRGLPPAYEQKSFPGGGHQGLRLLASPTGEDGSVSIHRAVKLYAGTIRAGEGAEYDLDPARYGWLQMISGDMVVNGIVARTGDGLSTSDERQLQIRAGEESSFLLFDLD